MVLVVNIHKVISDDNFKCFFKFLIFLTNSVKISTSFFIVAKFTKHTTYTYF